MNLNRAIAIGTVLGLSLAAGCSSQTGTAPLPSTDAPAQMQPSAGNPAFTQSSTTSVITKTAKITYVSPGKFNTYASGHYQWVTYSSTTTISGAIKVGYYATVTGAVSSTGVLVATSISTSSTESTALTNPAISNAQITYVASGKFNTYSSGHYRWVTYTSSTAITGTIKVGYYASVSGTVTSTGSVTASSIVVTTSPSGTPTSTPTPPPSTTVMKHINTEDYVGYMTSLSRSYSSLAPYLTWAQTVSQDTAGLHAVGIKTQRYIDPNRVSSGSTYALVPTLSSEYALSCSGVRVYTHYSTIVRYIPNPANSSYRTQFGNYINNTLGASNFDSVWDDDAEPPGQFGSYSPSLPCNYSDSSWISSEIGMLSYSKIPVMVNDLNALNGTNVSLNMNLVRSSAVWGGSFEECYNTTATPEQTGWVWQATENTELQVNALNKPFLCFGRYPGTASSNTAGRIYMLASFMLTYNSNLDTLFEVFQTASQFHVEPEEQLVALNPLKSTPSTITSLRTTTSGTYGTYGREYGSCYYKGVSVGPCAVAVNPDSVSHPFPFSGYKHTLYLSGGGILDGGTASVTGAAPSSTIAAARAVIAFKD